MTEPTFYIIFSCGLFICGILLLAYKLSNSAKSDYEFGQAASIQAWVIAISLIILGLIMFFKNI